MSEPSERMQHLIAALEASTIAGHDMHVNALKAAIAELEHKLDLMTRERNGLQRRVADLESQRGGSPMRGWVE